MTVTVINPDFTCPTYPLVAIEGFHTTTSTNTYVGSTALSLPSLAASELSQAIGENHTYVTLSDAGGAEDVEVWFEGSVLHCSPTTKPHPAGACVSGDNHPIVLYCLLKEAVPQGAAGPTGATGATGPAGNAGVGNNGQDGTPGSIWYLGSGAPVGTTGTAIDYYLDITTGDVYRKNTGSWVIFGSLMGPGGSDGTNNSTWYNGTGAPAPTLGDNQDFYIDTDTGDLWKKAGGTWGIIANIKGPQGIFGNDGQPGSRWFFGSTAPDNTFGSSIDYYLQITTGDVFSKATGTWVVFGSLLGPGGSDGTNGSRWYNGSGAPATTLGDDQDYYINIDNGDLYKHAGGSWGVIANIKGPQGIFGNDGQPGSRWFFGTAAPDNAWGSSIDYYLEIDSADWWQKSSGTWAIGGSLKGVPGTPGSNGAPGYSQSLDVDISCGVTNPTPGTNYTYGVSSTNYNDITGASVSSGVITLAAGAYMITGVIDQVHLSNVATNALSTVNTSVDVEVNAGSGYNLVRSTNVYVTSVFTDNTSYFGNGSVNGVVDLPSGGSLRFKVAHNSGAAVSGMSSELVVTVLRVQ